MCMQLKNYEALFYCNITANRTNEMVLRVLATHICRFQQYVSDIRQSLIFFLEHCTGVEFFKCCSMLVHAFCFYRIIIGRD